LINGHTHACTHTHTHTWWTVRAWPRACMVVCRAASAACSTPCCSALWCTHRGAQGAAVPCGAQVSVRCTHTGQRVWKVCSDQVQACPARLPVFLGRVSVYSWGGREVRATRKASMLVQCRLNVRTHGMQQAPAPAPDRGPAPTSLRHGKQAGGCRAWLVERATQPPAKSKHVCT